VPDLITKEGGNDPLQVMIIISACMHQLREEVSRHHRRKAAEAAAG
jgi:hypothetical protein